MSQVELNLSEKIKYLCEQKGITIKDLASQIDISFSGLYVAMKKDSIKVDTLLKISQVLEVNPGFFFQENPIFQKKADEKNSIEWHLISWSYNELFDLWYLKLRDVQMFLLSLLVVNPDFEGRDKVLQLNQKLQEVFKTSPIPPLLKTIYEYLNGNRAELTNEEIGSLVDDYISNKEFSGPYSVEAPLDWENFIKRKPPE